eukprot:CAMPEP_0181082578 /NCGR_PEP_ID=MMETSP1071-20121207/3696_1 /TAXON_ID=35127 /ORGANISM="Thalassiosira sp., Strain NH16" /LENGTH=337 /DNA_ID=CAMNT_0023164173 /DNA_START=43 /DNA_END=1053 /DNA_ORIENTATION=+
MSEPAANDCDRFIPTNPLTQGILKMLGDENSADVVFEVNGREKIFAHRLILHASAPSLAELCADANENTMITVPITNVEPDLFRHLLYYVYGGAIPDEVMSERSKEIIEAADRLGIANLKVEAEGWYVNSTPITWENFVNNFIFSDTKKCALLKEKVMGFLVEDEKVSLDRLSNQDVPQSESMLIDFLTALSMKKCNGEAYEFKTMSVNRLRRKLEQEGLGVDGTREMLVHSLEKHQGAVVRGAGVADVNGYYICAGELNGAPVYKKLDKNRGADFTLFRYIPKTGCVHWVISISPSDKCPGSEKDKVFYCSKVVSGDTERPPLHGWKCIDEGVGVM